MTAHNILDGMACPKCKQDENFDISVTSLVTFTDDGTEDSQGYEWGEDSYINCPECDWEGMVKDTLLKNQRANKLGDLNGDDKP